MSEVRDLNKYMVVDKRQYIIEKVKAPLMKAIITMGNSRTNFYKRVLLFIEILKLAKRYPIPTKANTHSKNTHIRLDILEDFKKNLNNPQRDALVLGGFKILIDECHHDGFYEFLHDEYILQLLKRGWQPHRRGFPMYRYWKAPLCPDNCMETDPKWQNYYEERKKAGTLIAEEYKDGTLFAMEEIFEGNEFFFLYHPELFPEHKALSSEPVSLPE